MRLPCRCRLTSVASYGWDPSICRPGRKPALAKPLLVVGGPARIDGVTYAPVVVLGGRIELNGRAEDDLVALPGDIAVASNAAAHGNVISLAGRIMVAPGADLTGSVIGQRTRLGRPAIVPARTSFDYVIQRLRLAGLAMSALLFLGLGVWTLLPWPALVTTATARRYRLWSVVLGIGTLLAAPLIVAPLAVSLAGLPLAVLLALGLGGLWLIGIVSTAGTAPGHRLLSLSHRPHSTLSANTGWGWSAWGCCRHCPCSAPWPCSSPAALGWAQRCSRFGIARKPRQRLRRHSGVGPLLRYPGMTTVEARKVWFAG